MYGIKSGILSDARMITKGNAVKFSTNTRIFFIVCLVAVIVLIMRALFHLGTDKWSCYGSKLEKKYFVDLDCIPRVDEWVEISEIVSEEDLEFLQNNSECWSGHKANVVMINLKKDEKGFYYWIWVDCEDR